MFQIRSHDHNDYQVICDQTFQELYDESQNEIVCKIYGYRNHKARTFVFHFIAIMFLGIPYVICRSIPEIKTFKYKSTALQNATILLVSDTHGNSTYVAVKTQNVIIPTMGTINLRYFLYQYTKYVWIQEKETFGTLNALIPQITLDAYLNNTNGLQTFDYLNFLKVYGENKIEIKVKSYWTLFEEEVFHPFYLFQAFSVTLWAIDDYVIYAACVVILTLFSSVTSLIQTRKQSEALRDLVESSKCHEVNVLRQVLPSRNVAETIEPTQLVPGDLIILPASDFIMPCDAVLITGQCIVNESVLTGESMPITKTALLSCDELYDVSSHKRHTLFAGTNVIQTRYYGGEHVLARVVRTGFDTTKGALVKSILFPAPVDLKFYKDSFKFVFVLFSVALTGMGYCLYLHVKKGAETKEIVLRTLDIITIIVPPALPAAMAIGTVYSQSRLKKHGIFCISPPRINVCGKIKLACFDKTGTLTHDGLDMNCIIPCHEAEFSQPVINVSELDINTKIVQGMATCHSLTRIDGVLNGDPLDLKMFQFTQWGLEEPGEDENKRYDMLSPTVVMPNQDGSKSMQGTDMPYQIGIIRQFPFSSTLQCMSVICRNLMSSHMTAFTKGAPEKLLNMCRNDTLGKDFTKQLSDYTTRGYRVIALAYKDLPTKFKWKDAQKCKRETIECDLIFLGFLIMQNPLKHETAPIIKTLHRANIRTVMITGDNILTAISVARDCGMVASHDQIFIVSVDHNDDPNVIPNVILEKPGAVENSDTSAINIEYMPIENHFAIDGKTWNKLRNYHPQIIPNLVVRTTVFARFQPDQKAQLITYLQNLDYVVSMVGDGANDCGALKAAHVGVSLSQAEASVAAPFTSSIPNISCIVHLILEGRCALVTSFAIFKFMALYSFIQFFSVLILYRRNSILGDFQFLFVDMIVTTTLAVTIARQGPYRELCPRRPTSSLVSLKNVLPLLMQIAACAAFQVAALAFLYMQKWFESIDHHIVKEQVVSWENTIVFSVSCYQYVILATIFSKGPPYREMLIKNSWFIASTLLLTISITWMMIYPCKEVAKIMEIMYSSRTEYLHLFFRLTLLVFPVAHLILAASIEMGIGDSIWFRRLIQFLKGKKMPKSKYKILLKERDFIGTVNLLSHRS